MTRVQTYWLIVALNFPFAIGNLLVASQYWGDGRPTDLRFWFNGLIGVLNAGVAGHYFFKAADFPFGADARDAG